MRADARKNYDQLLAVAAEVVATEGADASLRDIARQAGVGLGTLYRHFPTREALLEALLRNGFDALTARAEELRATSTAEEALVTWLREFVACADAYKGVTDLMAAAIEDPTSALHASCVTMRGSGAQLLADAQGTGAARTDVDGADLYALGGALAWIGDQPAFATRSAHLFDVVVGALLTRGAQVGATSE